MRLLSCSRGGNKYKIVIMCLPEASLNMLYQKDVCAGSSWILGSTSMIPS